MDSQNSDYNNYGVVHSTTHRVLLTILLCLPQAFVGMNNLASNFLSPRQDHWCYVPELGNLSAPERRQLAIPYDGSSHTYAQCEEWDVEWSSLTLPGETQRNASTRVCYHGHEFEQSTYVITATSEFELVCDSSWILELINPLYMVGMAVGAFSCGFLADAYGRKLCLGLATLLQVVAGLLSALAPNEWVYIVARSLTALSCRAAALTSLTLMMELLPHNRRGFAGVFFQICYIFGICYILIVSYFIRHFRAILLAMTLLVVPRFIYFFFLPESPRWLLSSGRLRAAVKELTRLSHWNGCTLPEDIVKEGMDRKLNKETCEKPKKTVDETSLGVKDLLRNPTIRRYTLTTFFCTSSNNLTFLGIGFNMGLLAGDVYTNMAISIGIDFVCYISMACLVNKFGRKTLLCSSFGVATLGMFSAIPFSMWQGYETIGTYLSLVARGVMGAGASIGYLLINELFPTGLRQRAVGLSNTVASIVSIIAPIVGGPLAYVWVPLPTMVFGSMALLGMFLFMGLPETKGIKLPDTIEESVDIARRTKDSSSTKAVFKGYHNDVVTVTEVTSVQPTQIRYHADKECTPCVPDDNLYAYSF